MAVIALLPLFLVLLWTAYLTFNGWSPAQGLQGYIWILCGSGLLGLFLALMMVITH